MGLLPGKAFPGGPVVCRVPCAMWLSCPGLYEESSRSILMQIFTVVYCHGLVWNAWLLKSSLAPFMVFQGAAIIPHIRSWRSLVNIRFCLQLLCNHSVRSENDSPYTATMYFFLVILGQSSKLSAP